MVNLVWIVSLSLYEINGAEWGRIDIIKYSVMAVIVDVLSLPFGIFGGKVGKNWKKTQLAIWVGTIIGTSITASLFFFDLFKY